MILASKKFCHSKQACMEIKSCAVFCNGEWSLEVLQDNNAYPPFFSAAAQMLLLVGQIVLKHFYEKYLSSCFINYVHHQTLSMR